jgi:hypothetical protein
LREQLRALVKVAEIDAKARGIEEQLKAIPSELEERRAALRALEALVERQRSAIAEAERLLAEQDADLAVRNDLLAKAKAKSARAKSLREVEAAERELETLRRSIKEGEAERERLREKIAQTRAALEVPEKTLAEQKAELAQAEAAAEVKLARLVRERETVLAGRDDWVSQIDKKYLRLYERLRQKLVPAVVEVVGETCTGCRMQMPPQRFIQLQRGTEILQCQSCQRIVYYRDVVLD